MSLKEKDKTKTMTLGQADKTITDKAEQCVVVERLFVEEEGVEDRDLTPNEIAEFAKANKAYFMDGTEEYFLLLFTMPGNKQIALLEQEIQLAIGNLYYGQCHTDCKRTKYCHRKDNCAMRKK
jgi:hypothetical protein